MVDLHQSARARDGGGGLAGIADVPVLVKNLRQITPDDMPWIQALCARRYDNRYDFTTSTAWALNIVLRSPLLFHAFRTDRAFSVSHLYTMPWTAKELEVDMMFVCAEEGAMWDVFHLCHASMQWARERSAKRWRISSDTGYELGPIAERLGARRISPRYVLDL